MIPRPGVSDLTERPASRRIRVAIFLAIAVLSIVLYNTRIHREMADFAVFRTAAIRVVNAEPLYRETDEHFQFKYLPAFALIVAPLAVVNEGTAEFLWFASSIVLLIVLMQLSADAVPHPRLSRRLLLALTLVLMAKFYARELLLGQANILLGVLLVMGMVAAQAGRGAFAAVLVAAAVFVKPYALVLMPWLLLTFGPRALLAAVAVMAAGLVSPVVVYGWNGNVRLLQEWWHTVSASTSPNLLNNDNVSVAAMWAKWLGVGATASAMTLLTLALVLLLCILVWRHRARVPAPTFLEFALLMLLIPLISPQGWDYVLLLATPAVMCLLDRCSELSRPWQFAMGLALATMGLTMFDLVGREVYSAFMALAVVSVCALAVTLGLFQIRRLGLA
jgi:hypothetical protein